MIINLLAALLLTAILSREAVNRAKGYDHLPAWLAGLLALILICIWGWGIIGIVIVGIVYIINRGE